MLPEFPTEAFDLLDQFLHLPSLPVWRVGSGQLLDLAISLVSIIAVIRMETVSIARKSNHLRVGSHRSFEQDERFPSPREFASRGERTPMRISGRIEAGS